LRFDSSVQDWDGYSVKALSQLTYCAQMGGVKEENMRLISKDLKLGDQTQHSFQWKRKWLARTTCKVSFFFFFLWIDNQELFINKKRETPLNTPEVCTRTPQKKKKKKERAKAKGKNLFGPWL